MDRTDPNNDAPRKVRDDNDQMQREVAQMRKETAQAVADAREMRDDLNAMDDEITTLENLGDSDAEDAQ